MAPSVEEFLAGLQGEAQFQSSGRFTLDAQRLRDRLLRYRLDNPWLYQLFLVRAGVAASASQIRRILARDFCATYFELDVPCLNWDQMARLCEPSLVHQEETSLSYLGRALEAALALRSSIQQVDIRSGNLRLSVKPGGDFELSSQETSRVEGIEFRLGYSWLRAMWIACLEGWNSSGQYGHVRVPMLSDGSVENRPAGASNMEILADGRLSGSWQSPHTEWVRVAWTGESSMSWLPFYGWDSKSHQHLFCSELDGAPRRALPEEAATVTWMVLDGRVARRALAVLWPGVELRWILDGVVVEREWTAEHPELGSWGGVVVADGLKLDLSGTRLVRDDAFTRRYNWLLELLNHGNAAAP